MCTSTIQQVVPIEHVMLVVVPNVCLKAHGTIFLLFDIQKLKKLLQNSTMKLVMYCARYA